MTTTSNQRPQSRKINVRLPIGWDIEAHTLWLNNQREESIGALLKVINFQNEKSGVQHVSLLKQFSYYLFLMNDYASAVPVMQKIAILDPNDFDTQCNLAVCLSRNQNFDHAAALYEKLVLQNNFNFRIWDGLAYCYSNLSKFEEASQAGEKSLELKDPKVMSASSPFTLPHQSPKDISSQKKKVISFSLFGNNPRYLLGALQNLLLSKELYNDWICRFYIDDQVPAEFVSEAKKLNAEIILNTGIYSLTEKLSWRFAVANDPQVGYFLIRDTDSVISLREKNAVFEWLKSEYYFHVMRDWWTHTELISAGMWGGIAGILPDLNQSLKIFQSKNQLLETPNADQIFLREVVWPCIRNSILVHDRFFESYQSKTWLGPLPSVNFHVGQDEFATRRSDQLRFLKSKLGQLSFFESQNSLPTAL